jgi:cell division protein FtsW
MMKKLAMTVFFDTFVLMLLGLIIVMSASSTYSAFKFESTFHLFNSHLLKVFLGLFFLLAFCFIPYEIYKYYSKWALLAIGFVLLLTLFLAPNIKGAGRWLDLGIITVQPADIAKLILIIHLATLIEQKEEFINDFKQGYLYAFIWVMLISGLIFIQPNISTAVLLVIISLTLLYVGGAKFKHIAVSSLFSFLIAGGFAMLFSHSRSRIIGFINAIRDGGDLNIQVKQALYGLGSGGITGVGIGNSKQNNLFLPEAYGDFIFAILGEEMGFVGSIIVLLSYLVLFIAGILIAKKAKDRFGQLLAFGITFSITLYAFVNVAVTTGLFPTTGLPLPFISYGGTSIIFLSISIGILINIAIMNSKRESEIQINTGKMVKTRDLTR